MCLDTLRKGFMAGCRKILDWDDTFFKGRYRGVLLITIGMDPNNGTYPVVYALVEAENRDIESGLLRF